jgi:F-box interacting protein
LSCSKTNHSDLSHQGLDPPIQGRLCGPCNGIFYVDSEDSSGSGLWNPATKEFKLLPVKIHNKSSLPLYYDDSSGFGFDPVTNNYKVVVIRESYTREYYLQKFPSSLVIVYTFRTDSWRCWGSLDQGYTLLSNYCYKSVDGVSYWRAGHGHMGVILSFNMATDAFQELQGPNYDKPAYSRLVLYHDSIAFSTVHDIEKFLDIWVR